MAKGKMTEQMKRFADAARELGCDDDEDSFNKVLSVVASAPRKKPATKSKTKKAADK